MSDYPPELPPPLLTGYQATPAPSFVAIEVWAGPTVFVPRQSDPPERIAVSWYVQHDQIEAWRSWYVSARHTWFLLPLRDYGRTDATFELRGSVVRARCHFVDEPVFALDEASGEWRITSTVERAS